MPRFTIYLVLAIMSQVGRCAVDTSICAHLPCEYAQPGILKRTALASFQGSGNTWMRQTIAIATGIKTGDHYVSYGDDLFPEFSSRHDDTVIAVKTHKFSSSMIAEFDQAIVILRHPWNSLLAEFNRMYGGNKTGEAAVKQFVDAQGIPTWKWELWTTYISSWSAFYEFWIGVFPKPVLFVTYNDLQRDLEGQVNRMLKFFNWPQNSTRMECLLNATKGYFVRNHTSSSWTRQKLFELSFHKTHASLENIKEKVQLRYGVASQEFQSISNVTATV